MSDNNGSSHGVGVLELIQIVLVILKVLNLIDCKWWIVFIPTYIVAGIILMILIVGLMILIVALIACVIENRRWK